MQFAFANYCVMGWFIGQARAKLTFLVQLVLNLTNMALSAAFVLWLGMTSDGVGLASLIAEIVAAVIYFASDDSAYTTGSELLIDGGAMAQ